jgi:L-rhamnose-H+ transport protein
MVPNPLLGLLYHWTGGLAAASFYIPYRRVKHWAWETYWLVGGVFSWLVAPWIMALLLVPDTWGAVRAGPPGAVGWAYMFGVLWGLGGLTFGLTVRYLGIALGVAIALGLCNAFGTLVPPIVEGDIGEIAASGPGRLILLGVAVALVGIGISGLAGVSKERELSSEEKQAAVPEFNFTKGMLVATFCGIMSACFAYGLAAGTPIAQAARAQLIAANRSELWQNLPVLVVVLAGGFTTNFVWCVILNVRNRTAHQYLNLRRSAVGEVSAAETVMQWDADALGESAGNNGSASHGLTAGAAQFSPPAPLLANYAFAAVAGIVWYLQFFFYSMGETQMGRYGFSSWTLHMASIIIFSTLWGIALKEWKGTSRRTRVLLGVGLAVLIASTLVVGYGNFLKTISADSSALADPVRGLTR